MKDSLVTLAAVLFDLALVAAYLWLFYQFMRHPKRIVRLGTRMNRAIGGLMFAPEMQRVFRAEFAVRVAYSWFGTSGSAERDARYEWRAGMYLRFMFIFGSVFWLLVIVGVL